MGGGFEVCPVHGVTDRMITELKNAIQQIAEKQSDRNVSCATQDSRIDALEESDRKQWELLESLKSFHIKMTLGIALVNIIIVPACVGLAVKLTFSWLTKGAP